MNEKKEISVVELVSDEPSTDPSRGLKYIDWDCVGNPFDPVSCRADYGCQNNQ